MTYGDSNQPDGSFRGPGRGAPPADFELPRSLQQSTQRNLLSIARIRSDNPVTRLLLQQEIEDLTFAHTGQTVSEQKADQDAYYTAMMQADLGSTAVHGGD